jgi:hypothetical protein
MELLVKFITEPGRVVAESPSRPVGLDHLQEARRILPGVEPKLVGFIPYRYWPSVAIEVPEAMAWAACSTRGLFKTTNMVEVHVSPRALDRYVRTEPRATENGVEWKVELDHQMILANWAADGFPEEWQPQK